MIAIKVVMREDSLGVMFAPSLHFLKGINTSLRRHLIHVMNHQRKVSLINAMLREISALNHMTFKVAIAMAQIKILTLKAQYS